MTDRSGVAKQLTHGSLFAGIGGFDRGFELAGFRTIWQVEKEPFCIAVLKTHFPNVERYYDVLKCGHDKIHKLRAVDVLTAGFPCQDLSVAGKRAGLEGSRSGLFWEVVRILGELRPTWFVLENVPGLFSSCEGRDFAVVLNALDELGYGVAWRVLNSQFFGVAQRRRRVFIVGCFGKPCPAEVLFESEGGGGDIETGGKTWQDSTYSLATSIRATGEGDYHGDGTDNLAIQHPLQAALESLATRRDEGERTTLTSPCSMKTSEETLLLLTTPEPCEAEPVTAISSQLPSQRTSEEKLEPVTQSPHSAEAEENQEADIRPLSSKPSVPSGPKEAQDQPEMSTTTSPSHLAATLSTKNEPANSAATREEMMNTMAELTMSVRRLTPTECETLQGFPRGWTVPDTEHWGTRSRRT